MDFTIPDELLELKERTERFVREQILPCEADPRLTPHGPTDEFRRALVALARKAGLVSPHVGREWGGLGLDHRGKAVVFEAAGYAPLATIAMNILRARRSQHAFVGADRRRAAEGGVAAPARRGPGPLLLHDDRAGPGCRRRPLDAVDDG